MRNTIGVGQHIDMSLLDSAVAVMANQALNYLATNSPPKRTGNYHPNLTPYQTFECKDGHIIIATGNDAQFCKLCHILGLPDLAHSPEFLKNADRVTNREKLIKKLSAKTIVQTKNDLLSMCEAEGVPAGPINNLREVFENPQVIHRGLLMDLDGIPSIKSPFKFSRASLNLSSPSPKLGE